MKHLVVARDKYHLKMLIRRNIEVYGFECDLNYIDVSNVTNMHNLFYNSKFNGDISKWDVSNVVDMNGMFFQSNFNGDISNWDVSNVKYMNGMFYNTPLEKNNKLPKWYNE